MMLFRKLIVVSVTLIFSILFASTVSAQSDIKVVLDNKQVQFSDVHPVIQNGRTLIPVRKVFSEAGAKVAWQENTQTVHIQLSENTVTMPIGDRNIQKRYNDTVENYLTDVPSQIINNRTYIPLRATGELLGYKVDWDQDNRVAFLDSNFNEDTQNDFGSSVHAFELKVLELVNEERSKRGILPLELDPALSNVAREKSRDMLTNGYFSHTSPTYGSPFDMMKAFDISYLAAGENIAAGQSTPIHVMTGWMNSEGHRKNILEEDFTHIGIGFVEGNQGYYYYWTQMFLGK